MIDYTEYDYDDLVDRITELYRDKEGFTDVYESSTSQTLIQLLADTTDHLMYMLERRAQESFIDTARLDSSIRSRASEIGYRARRRVSSTGTVLLKLVDSDGEDIEAEGNIEIPSGTSLSGSGEDFVTTEDVTIEEGETEVEIPIKEGVQVEQQYNFDDESYQDDPTIVIENYIQIEEFSLRVSDGSGEYDDVGSPENQRFNITSLSYAMSNDFLYDIRYSYEGMRILFGDGEFGHKPSGNVNVSWVESSGEDVSIQSTGNEFNFEDEFLTDDRQVTPVKQYRYEMTNITPIRGGQDEESVRDIARNAPEFARTANRAVTSSDHEFWVMRSGIGDIVDVKVYGEQETDELIFNMNNVQISYVTGDELPLNVEQLQQLRDFMDKYKMVTTHLAFNEVDKVELVLDIDFKRDSQIPITNEHVYEVIREYVNDYFEIKRGSIGKEVKHSELVKFLQDSMYEFSGINYPVCDWVKVNIQAQYPIEMPINVYDVLVSLDDSYDFTDGDEFTIVLDGDSYTVTVETDDDVETLMERMRVEISDNTPFLTALEDSDTVLRIKAPYLDTDFTINVNQGDLSSYVSSDIIFQIPPSTLSNQDEDELIEPGSVTIVDEDENIIFEDDGDGMMQPAEGVSEPAFEIDYIKCMLISPSMEDGEYLIRYSQNEYQNFDANFRSVITLSPLADEINDDFLYSKMRIL